MIFISELKPEHTGKTGLYAHPDNSVEKVKILEKEGYPKMPKDILEHNQFALVEFESGKVKIVHCTNIKM